MTVLRREDIDKLPLEERLRILDEVWASIEERPEDLPFTDEQRAELDRRLAAHR